jgi:hypothetical protein
MVPGKSKKSVTCQLKKVLDFLQNYLCDFHLSRELRHVFYLRLIPESPSWLLVVGQEEKAMNQLRIVAKINRKNFQAGFFYIFI